MTAVFADTVVTEAGPKMRNSCDTADTAVSGARAQPSVMTSGGADLDSRRAGIRDDHVDSTDTSDPPVPESACTEPTEVVLTAIGLLSEVGDIVVTGSNGDQVYVATINAVAVINHAHEFVGTIPIAGHPKRMAANADRTHIVVTTYQGPVVIIDTTDNTTTTARATPAAVEAVSQTGTRVYLEGTAADGTGIVTALNVTDTTTLAVTVAGRVTTLVVSADGRRLYAAASGHVVHHQYDTGWLVVIDTATFTILDRIAVGALPDIIAANPDASSIYVGHSDTSSLSAVDLARGRVNTIALLDSPLEAAVSPDGNHLYVMNRDSVAVIDAATQSVQTVAAGTLPRRLEFGPDGKRAYVTHLGGRSVSVIDTPPTRSLRRSPLVAIPRRWA